MNLNNKLRNKNNFQQIVKYWIILRTLQLFSGDYDLTSLIKAEETVSYRVQTDTFIALNWWIFL